MANIGGAFKPMTADGEWDCASKIYDTDAVLGDVVMFLNVDVFDLDSYLFIGYDDQGNSLGWVYTTQDPNTGDPIEQEVKSFKLAKGAVTYCQPADGESPFTTAGEVTDTSKAATVTFADSDWFELVNPFPKDTTFGDLESFCALGDYIFVLNFNVFDLDSYLYLGEGQGWVWSTQDPNTGDPIEEELKDSTQVVIPAGQGGYLQTDGTERVWTVTL